MEKDQSQFPMLQTLLADKQPHEQLWTTALNFQVMSDEWMNGERESPSFFFPSFPHSFPCLHLSLPPSALSPLASLSSSFLSSLFQHTLFLCACFFYFSILPSVLLTPSLLCLLSFPPPFISPSDL